MTCIAGASPDSQSLLQSSHNPSPASPHTTGAGSTTISDPQSSLQDSQSSIDPETTPTNSTNILPEQPSDSTPQSSLAENPRTEGEFLQNAEVIDVVQDKGGGSGTENVQPDLSIVKEEGEVLLSHVNGQIELVEHTSSNDAGLGDAGMIMADDSGEWLPDSDHELKRVKVGIPHISFRLTPHSALAHLRPYWKRSLRHFIRAMEGEVATFQLHPD